MLKFKKPRIPLPPSFNLLDTDWKGMVATGDVEQIGKQLSWMLADVKTLPWFTQNELKKAANGFIRARRPLPPTVASLPQFQLNDGPLMWSSLEPGDIIFVRPNPAVFQGFLWAMHYSHVGIYVKPGFVMEAKVNTGVSLMPVKRWMRSHAYMGFARVKPGLLKLNGGSLADEMAKSILEWSEGKTKYNLAMWNEAGTTLGKSYCSELIWMMYEGMGIDLRDEPRSEIYVEWVKETFGEWASTAIAEPAIAPDELALSSKLEFFSVGKTR